MNASELYQQWQEGKEPGWDGYGAEPVTEAKYLAAVKFFETIPEPWRSRAESCCGPDGEFSFDWCFGRGNVLSVSSNSERDRLPYAWLRDDATGNGVIEFDGTFPRELLAVLEAFPHE